MQCLAGGEIFEKFPTIVFLAIALVVMLLGRHVVNGLGEANQPLGFGNVQVSISLPSTTTTP